MELFDVYPLLDVTPERASGCTVWDDKGVEYLDLYGGHAVISIGHTHPHYVERISGQLAKIGFYSNSVQNPLQRELASLLGRQCGYAGYRLFLCNSGAEANENAIKLASFVTGRKKFIAFGKGFHGRTSAAVALTDNPKIAAPVNLTDNALILPFNDLEAVGRAFRENDIAGVLVEGIQGIGGIRIPAPGFLAGLEQLCKEHGALLILDEIQSGYGRTGKFFAHQYDGVTPALITMAKGMGNGFPIGGLLISPEIEAHYGMLGTTFGGSHLACAAALAVLEVMEEEKLTENAAATGHYLMDQLRGLPPECEVRGRGLMTGIEFPYPVKNIRDRLLHDFHIFTGFSGTHTLRLLPPLCLSREQARVSVNALFSVVTPEG
ncbi:MAG: aspartate aminotransferase family protein [Prolixibacteraceae bacterium]|nr:aspartate aminotransferase family protein [Prolixibacteraceae bacterium]